MKIRADIISCEGKLERVCTFLMMNAASSLKNSIFVSISETANDMMKCMGFDSFEKKVMNKARLPHNL